MSIIKNVSKITIKIDNVNIPPYQTHKFDTIIDRLSLNRYTNRHMIEFINEPVVEIVENIVKTPKVETVENIVEKTEEIKETTTIEDTNVEEESTKKSTKSGRKKSVKTDDENIEMKGEIDNASD